MYATKNYIPNAMTYCLEGYFYSEYIQVVVHINQCSTVPVFSAALFPVFSAALFPVFSAALFPVFINLCSPVPINQQRQIWHAQTFSRASVIKRKLILKENLAKNLKLHFTIGLIIRHMISLIVPYWLWLCFILKYISPLLKLFNIGSEYVLH